jgi:hypothetical protein
MPEDYQSDEYGRPSHSQFQQSSRIIGSAASNSSGTAAVSLSGAGRCASNASNFADLDPIEAEAYAAQLAAAGRRYDTDSSVFLELEYASPVMGNGSTGSGGAIIETNDAYEDYDS